MDLINRTHAIYTDLVVSWLRSEIATLNNVLDTIIRNDNYHDEYIHESMKKAEVAIRQIRKFISSN